MWDASHAGSVALGRLFASWYCFFFFSRGEGQPCSAGPVPLAACPALGPARDKLESGSSVDHLPDTVVLVWTQRRQLSCEVRSVCHW